MPRLFGFDIGGEIARRMGPGLRLGTLRTSIPGTRLGNDLAAGNSPSTTTHSFRGYKEPTTVLRAGTLVEDASAVITILAGTIKPFVRPDEGDTVILDGETFTIVGPTQSDPAEATFLCQVG